MRDAEDAATALLDSIRESGYPVDVTVNYAVTLHYPEGDSTVILGNTLAEAALEVWALWQRAIAIELEDVAKDGG